LPELKFLVFLFLVFVGVIMSFEGKKILVTGVCGTIGSALVHALLSDEYGPGVNVVGIDINESEIFYLANQYKDLGSAKFRLIDIRDRDALVKVFKGVNIVIHAAALKHVAICEDNPDEMLQTNLLGVRNVIHAANINRVEKVVFTSSDKAVNPSSNMGASKLVGEGLIRSASKEAGAEGPIFASTRFGNVLGSRGSVIPIFLRQIQEKSPLTLTHKEMTRFVMGIDQAVTLVLDSVSLARGGEIFVTKMPILAVLGLAEVMLNHFAAMDVGIKEIGIKPGEKLYEELMTEPESQRAIELEKYFVIFPSEDRVNTASETDYGQIVARELKGQYNSHLGPFMTHGEILAFLKSNDLLSFDGVS
jgi:FlaA1/EpsC-like NDP-sugar epimerase